MGRLRLKAGVSAEEAVDLVTEMLVSLLERFGPPATSAGASSSGPLPADSGKRIDMTEVETEA